MIDVNHLCPGCMGRWEDPSGACPRCGFSWEKVRKGGRELEPFTILAGRYLLGVRIGEESSGMTYLAMDLEKEQPVAVKEFFPASLARREGLQVVPLREEEGRDFRKALREFRREAELLSRRQGLPGSESFRELAEENGTLYLVTDFVEGMTVEQYMRRKGKPFTEELYGPVPEPAAAEPEEEQKKKRRWPLFLGLGAAAAAAAAAVVVFLLPGGAREANTLDSLSLAANRQEDGSVWFATGDISFQVNMEELPEENWEWETSGENHTDWTFSGEKTTAVNFYSYTGGDSGTNTVIYDEEGRILFLEDSDLQISREYTYGESFWSVTTYENGRMAGEIRTDLDDQGRAVRVRGAGYDENGDLSEENEETYVYEDHADGTYSLDYRLEGWNYTEGGEDGTRIRTVTTETAAAEYDEEGRILSQDSQRENREEGSPASFRNHIVESYAYDEQGQVLTCESSQEYWNGEPGGSEDHWTYTYRYTYENSYDEEGRLIRRILTNETRDEEELTETRSYYLFTYDAWGNQLTSLSYDEDAEGNVSRLSFSSRLYEKFAPENGILTATGETSGTLDPEMPQMGASSAEEAAEEEPSGQAGESSSAMLDIEDLDEELADLQMVAERQGKILAPPEEGDLGYQGVVSGIYDVFLSELVKPLLEDEGTYREDLYYVLPPESWDHGDVLAAAVCGDPQTAWELTQAFYQADLYEYTGSWAQLIRGLQSGETDLVFPEKDRWKWPLMEQYISYIAETEGRELALADENGNVQVSYP